MAKNKNSIFENLQVIVFTITYVISSISVYVLLYFLIDFIPSTIAIILSVIYFILALVLGMYLHFLFSIPENLPGTYDDIKNSIASGDITKSSQFSDELSSFLIEFYNYSFFDIQYSAVNAVDSDLVCSSPLIKDIIDWIEIEEQTKSSSEVQKSIKVKIDRTIFHVSTIPIYFNDKYLGFFSVFTKQKLGMFRTKLLCDLENNYIDDQLMQVIPK